MIGENGTTGSPGQKGDQGVAGPPGEPVGGVTYNRWGSSSCRSGADLVYAGRTGSTPFNIQGGAANIICMPNDPDYSLPFRSGAQGYNYVYGTEYEDPLVPGRGHHNAPCAVCYVSTQNAVIMIPAKTTCPSGWTREYYGYLMSEARLHQRSMYQCVDMTMESLPGSEADVLGGLFYHVEAVCDGVACPPYDDQKELTCVVCTK